MKKSSTVVGGAEASQGGDLLAGRPRKPCCPPVEAHTNVSTPPDGYSRSLGGRRVGATIPAMIPSAEEIERLGELFAVLANATRLRLLFALHPDVPTSRDSSQSPVTPWDDDGGSERDEWRRELCVCDLAAIANASQSMTSHQLHLLRRAGLVEFRRIGKHALYRLSDGPHAHLLLDALDHVAKSRVEPNEEIA